MPDIRLLEQQQQIDPPALKAAVSIDWVRNGDGIDDSQALATAVIVALGSDMRADADDPLPDNLSNDRRGWWGDLDAEEIWDGWPLGTRLWVMQRDKITGPAYRRGATIAKAEGFVRESLKPFVDARIISRFTVRGRQINIQRVDVDITLERSGSPNVDLQFALLWDELPASHALNPYR